MYKRQNYSLAANGNFGINDVAPTQRSFYICRDKLTHILVDSHTIYHVSAWSAYISLFTESEKVTIEYTRE